MNKITPKGRRFEHFSQPLLSRENYLRRIMRHGGFAVGFIVACLLVGMAGYHALTGMSWVDAFLNASMILTGMGPISQMASAAAKIFSGCYALFSGIAFLTSMGILFAPVLHRAMHRFHLGQ
jgi:hypothetical protein